MKIEINIKNGTILDCERETIAKASAIFEEFADLRAENGAMRGKIARLKRYLETVASIDELPEDAKKMADSISTILKA